MILEVREVGRKTPKDGRLEISAQTFRRLAVVTTPLQGQVGVAVGPATLDRMACGSCAGVVGGHDHLFIRSEAFAGLVAGETCVIELADDGHTILVARPHPL